MFYVGLDVHARSIAGCILNADGKRIKEFGLKGETVGLMAGLMAELRLLPGKVRVCYEASCGYGPCLTAWRSCRTSHGSWWRIRASCA